MVGRPFDRRVVLGYTVGWIVLERGLLSVRHGSRLNRG